MRLLAAAVAWLDLEPGPYPTLADDRLRARAEAVTREGFKIAAIFAVQTLAWAALATFSGRWWLLSGSALCAALSAATWYRYRRLVARVEEAKRDPEPV